MACPSLNSIDYTILKVITLSFLPTKNAIALATVLTFSALITAPQIAVAASNPLIDLSVKSEGIISAITALKKTETGELLLVDIRSPQEWKETGTGTGANKISMHQPGFIAKLDALTGNDKSKPVAFICATGGRSNWLQGELVKRGYTNILDVSEGMLGSSSGPGWLKRGLPVVH